MLLLLLLLLLAAAVVVVVAAMLLYHCIQMLLLHADRLICVWHDLFQLSNTVFIASYSRGHVTLEF